MITTVTIDAADVLAKLRAYPAASLQAIRRTMDDQNELTVSTIIQERLGFKRAWDQQPGGGDA